MTKDRPRNRFAKGSGCYRCRICEKLTRSTGRGDNENCQLCVACFDACGVENEHYDGYHDEKPAANCPLCTIVAKGDAHFFEEVK